MYISFYALDSRHKGMVSLFRRVIIVKTQTGSAKSRVSKRAACLSIAAALAVTSFAGMGAVSTLVNAAPSNEYGLVENIQDGVILHCFDWKYTDIIDSLDDIAKAGFSAVQTSPVQPAEGTGPWYWLYQPTAFKVAENGDLGTAEELKELCDAAERYGIKVIVDVVANHLAGDHNNIQQDLAADEYWHDFGPVISYKNRYEVTHGDIGMQDINSEHEYVQQVVKGFVDELKDMGVDGIRWDAAKHIGLPSEDCDFWAVVTDSGLYNYGEILNGPYDGGGEDLMVEYTKYMSVTDNTYSKQLADSFNSGKAPVAGGNWTTEGVAADKIVYWGESHDTYSNKEGKDTNAYSQNTIDRAYAVAAARAESSALYLSRPFAKARESIRIGVKGAMQFTSPEIAAVNHFHNAMVGMADIYGVTDNNAVIVRKGGGAVIVCGSGDGAVTVENFEGYVPAGTYYDEVTGNEFVVTEDTISGTVGESGIAVVYDSAFAGKVYADKLSDTEFSGTMDVTLHTVAADNATYSVFVDGENRIYDEGSFVDGDVVTIGKDMPDDVKVILSLKAEDKNGDPVSAVYKYNKVADRSMPEVEAGGIVFDNSKAKWDTINIYVYDESGAETITNGSWPGVEMTDCGENYYSYQLPEKFATCDHIMIIFNNGKGDQIPGAMQTGMTMKYTDKKLYDGNKWTNYPGEGEDPEPEPEPGPEASAYSIIGSMPSSGWSTDIPMYETSTGVFEGEFTVAAGSYEFKVRKDGSWDLSWGVYEEDYDRTQNSQTNVEIKTEGTTTVKVKLDTRGDDLELWPVSYAFDDGEYVYTGKPGDEPEPDPEPSAYSIIGSMPESSWAEDIPMYEVSEGIYEGSFTVKEGSYELKVRKDHSWDLSWGTYEEEYDRTQNSQTNVSIDVTGSDTLVRVRLDTTGDDLELWPVSVAFNDGEFYSTGKPDEEPDPEPLPVSGGWEFSEIAANNITAEEREVLEEALANGYKGQSRFEAVDLISAESWWRGVRYAYLCKETPEGKDAPTNWSIVSVYSNMVEEYTTLVSIKPIDPDNIKTLEEIPEISPGNWVASYNNEASAPIPEAVKNALDSNMGLSLTPTAVIGTQLVAGRNYRMLAYGTLVTETPTTSIYVVEVYEMLDGTAEITNIAAFDIDAYCTNPDEEPSKDDTSKDDTSKDDTSKDDTSKDDTSKDDTSKIEPLPKPDDKGANTGDATSTAFATVLVLVSGLSIMAAAFAKKRKSSR